MKKFDVKMLALDIDGTLMNSRKEFPENNCRALQECERRGIKIALVSGRSFELMRQFARQLGVHPLFAACNGTRIEGSESGPTLAEFTYTREQAMHICSVLEKSGMYFNAYRRGKCYMGNPHVRESLGSRYAHHIPGICGEEGFLYETVCNRDRLWDEGMNDVYKFLAMGAPYDPGFDRLAEELRDMNLSISKSSKRNIEFMPTGVDKGSAVRILCEKTGVEPAQVMAFGDQTNDIPMLNASGIPVAMENGEDAVKAVAKIIAPMHNLGGVALALEEYVL